MFKSLYNLLIILTVCIVAMGISVLYSPILDESSIVHSSNNEQITLLASSDYGESLLNPNDIYIKYKSDESFVLDFNEEYQFSLKIFKNEALYKVHNIYNHGSTQVEFTKDTPYSVNINLSQEELELPNGEYKIEIMPNINNNLYNINPLIFNIKYLSNVPYFPAVSNIPDGKTALNLYFMDNQNLVKQLIGITRFINYTQKPLTSIIDELKKGPSLELGLNMNPIVGSYNYVSLKGTTLYVDLPSNEGLYTNGGERSEASMNSLIKSYANYPGVENVRFLVDYNRASTFFNDKDITKSFTINSENKAFLAYASPNRYFLIECDVDNIAEDMTIEKKISSIFQSLQNSSYEYLSSTIPSEIKLLNSRLENNVLILNFDDSFLSAYEDDNNLNRMMLDSILFSFTSLKEIDKVKILINGEVINNFASLDLSYEMPRPLFLNPEN